MAFGASTALGILGGGVGGGGGPQVSALSLFKRYQADQVGFRQRFAERADIERTTDNFRRKAGGILEVEDLIKDRKTLGVVLSAFGLEGEINNGGKIKAILKSDPDDINSFANRLTDPRFRELAEFFSEKNGGLDRIRRASAQTELVDRFLQNEFEKDLGQQNAAVRDALFFLRTVPTINSSFDILGNLPLRTIVTQALNLPREIARQSVDKQASLIDAKFDVSAASGTSSDGATSKTRLQLLDDDIAAVTTGRSQVSSAQTVVAKIQAQLESLRTRLEDLPNVTDVAGVNAAEIPVQEAALPDLLRQAGLITSANKAITEANPLVNNLDGLFAKLRAAEDQETLDSLISEFNDYADQILGDTGIINSATYTDPSTGNVESLLRSDGDAGLGITAIAGGSITTTVDSDGTAVITKGFDLDTFLTNLDSARTQVNALTLGSLSAGVAAAESDFDLAKDDFDDAKLQIGVGKASFVGSTAAVDFANELDTQSLSTAISSLDDGLDRLSSVESLLNDISSLAKQATTTGADIDDLNTQYQLKLSALTDAINNPGSVTDGTNTITFDNVLTGGTINYSVETDIGLTADVRGGSLDTSILAGLPTDLTVANANTINSSVQNTYLNEVEALKDNLTVDRNVFEFAANVADPQGVLDAEIRKLSDDLDKLIAGAEVEKKNLLSPFADDLKITLNTFGTTLKVSAQTGFKDSFADALSGLGYTALNGGTSTDRTSLLNDALFAASSAASRLRGSEYALGIQQTILEERRGTVASDDELKFLKPLENTNYAVKFIEQYLIRQDALAAGGSVGPQPRNAYALGLVQTIAPANGLSLNLLR